MMAPILLFTSPGADWFKKAPRVTDLETGKEGRGDPPAGPR